MKKSTLAFMLLGLLGPTGVATFAAPAVEEKVVGPVGSEMQYAVSPRGAHLASVGRKGSRTVATVDGVEGPRFDEIVMPGRAWVDPRPYLAHQRLGTVADLFNPKIVVFSQDGRRHAYVGRRGQEWVLMVDGKESVTLPVISSGGNVQPLAFAMEFTGTEGKHLVFVRSVFEGNELWVDSQKWPGHYTSGGGGSDGTVDPLISPDGSRIAGMSFSQGKSTVVLDGKDTGYLAGNLAFSADSKNLIGVAQVGPAQALLVDGKPLMRAATIPRFLLSPFGSRIVATVSEHMPDGTMSSFLVVDGKRVDASRTKGTIGHVAFSPDGKRYAAICGGAGAQFVVVDGKKGQEYSAVSEPVAGGGLLFTADSARVIYIAGMMSPTPAHFVVINEEESDGLYNQPGVWVSRDGKRIAYGGRLSSQTKEILSIDGKVESFATNDVPTNFSFGPRSGSYAYETRRTGLVIDGKPTNLGSGGNFNFSPDGNHVAVFGHRPADGQQGLFVNGQLVYGAENNHGVRHRAFTPDSKHLFWLAMEPAAGAKAGPGVFEWVTYLDGKPVARCDRNETSGKISGAANVQLSTDQPAWEMGTNGTLTFLGPVGDVVKRFTIAPAADTSVATMIAEAAEAPAKAAAAKKKAADEAAAKKKK